MVDLAAHVRIFEKHPDDDFVTKRVAAASEVSASISKVHQSQALLSLGQGLAEGTVDGAVVTGKLAELTVAALKKKSPAFVPEGRQLEINTIALAAVGARMASTGAPGVPLSTTDILALATWSALSFQRPNANGRLEALRSEVLGQARSRVQELATRARVRKPVLDVKFPPKDPGAPALAAELEPGLSPSIAALRENALLDREEIDLLWWALSGWSEIFQSPFSALTPAQAAISAGLEVARQTRRVPGDSHKHLLLRAIEGTNEKFELSELVKALGADRQKPTAYVAQTEQVLAAPAVFPLLHALETGAGGDNAAETLTVGDWAARALLEGSILFLSVK